MECQLEEEEEEEVGRRRWHRSLRDIITMQLSLINTCAYLLVIKIRN